MQGAAKKLGSLAPKSASPWSLQPDRGILVLGISFVNLSISYSSVSSLKEQCFEKITAIATMPVFGSGKEIEDLRARLVTAGGRTQQLEGANQQLSEANRQLTQYNQSIFNNREELQERIRVSDIRHKEEVHQFQTNINDLAHKAAQLESELGLVTDQNTKRTLNLKNEIDNSESKLARCESFLSQAQRDIDKEKEKYSSLDLQANSLKAEILAHLDEKNHLKKLLEESHNRVQQAEARNQELELTIENLQAKLNNQAQEQSNEAKYEQDVEDIERNNNTKALRKLKDLIRQKYKLDVEIWRDRNSLRNNRPKVLKKMAQADQKLQDIIKSVTLWDNSTGLYSEDEWETAEIIRNRIFKDGKKVWANRPPWINAHGVEEDEQIFVRKNPHKKQLS
jgi:chromosome segregation ATPase